jgi:4-alpha-glucanotransferase
MAFLLSRYARDPRVIRTETLTSEKIRKEDLMSDEQIQSEEPARPATIEDRIAALETKVATLESELSAFKTAEPVKPLDDPELKAFLLKYGIG